ncbi:MAG: 3-phosphoshikimate 1-carboxyvinyltransferase [Flavobacteriaceae bacterium]|nr:3-phosphoshikimate 1-carboxyvinyltransferase [Flavobacteriaceae bacterium]|tara:strand:- start:23788 stop:25020 length:1233 start_codon:yes stop_codon:yes gene_type:complete
MDIKLFTESNNLYGKISINGSKSESNRLLILKALYPNLILKNLSNSDDTILIQKALNNPTNIIDVSHAGTAMRFLTAYYASKPNSDIILTGSKRMKNRPIGILVDSLVKIGASIEYLEKDGFPPLRINGKKLLGNFLNISASVSSQFITALILIAPTTSKGMTINLLDKVTSQPYINMSISLLKKLGINVEVNNDNKIIIYPKEKISATTISVESDWSSASYYYSLVALSNKAEIKLSGFKNSSLQGDSCLKKIYKKLGVLSIFDRDFLILKKDSKINLPNEISLNLIDSPDLAQTISVTCFGLGVDCKLTGLHTLKFKETDRLIALKNEFIKLGAKVSITNDSFYLKSSNQNQNDMIKISTYNDHRMAMSFAPLSLFGPIIIENYKVVSKSYPNFWADLESIGFKSIIN